MIPCSIKQIAEEGRRRQQDALAAAERERCARRAAQGAPGERAAQGAPGERAAPGRGVHVAPALATARHAGERLIAAVGAVVRLGGAHP
jgi:hypothetical protein